MQRTWRLDARREVACRCGLRALSFLLLYPESLPHDTAQGPATGSVRLGSDLAEGQKGPLTHKKGIITTVMLPTTSMLTTGESPSASFPRFLTFCKFKMFRNKGWGRRKGNPTCPHRQSGEEGGLPTVCDPETLREGSPGDGGVALGRSARHRGRRWLPAALCKAEATVLGAAPRRQRDPGPPAWNSDTTWQ